MGCDKMAVCLVVLGNVCVGFGGRSGLPRVDLVFIDQLDFGWSGLG